MSPLKMIGGSVSALLFVPVLFLAGISGSFGASLGSSAEEAGSTVSGDRADIQNTVLTDPRIQLTPNARYDVESGTVDLRVLEILLVLARSHDLGPVGPLITGHSYYVAGTTRVSNHVFGRALDILGVDGVPVSIANVAAGDVMQEALGLSPPLRPDELGGPFPFSDPNVRTFTEGHHDHIHIGWDAK